MARLLVTLLLVMAVMALSAQNAGQRQDGNRHAGTDTTTPTAVATQRDLSLVSGCPTASSITVNIISAVARESYLEYGVAPNVFTRQTTATALPADTPVNITLNDLKLDTAYYYRIRMRLPGATAYASGDIQSFHTQRAPGSTFTFAIQGDSHPERPQQHNSALYAQTLAAAAADHPDFFLTSGDDFSVDTLRTITADTVRQVYLRQRYQLSRIGQSVPLFLVNGNHEQAAACNLDGTPDNVAVWAQTSRHALFPQPAPDAFYTGDAQPVEHIGLLRDYYAWMWGDALFVVIDPYWHSPVPVDNVRGSREHGTRDLWQVTLGDAQYAWLRTTLEKSTAKYKFVFTHHVLGTGRGGVEQAGLYEWGGKDRNGADLFSEKRPTWAMPIHQLFVKTGVTIVFQGHDHLFARQQLDGIVYQTLPDPANPNYVLNNDEAYRSGDKLPGSGYVRVTVSPKDVSVDYVRQYLPADETADRHNGEVAFHYAVAAHTSGDQSAGIPAHTFTLSSPAVTNGAALPVEFTGDGDGVTPPLAWSGAPTGTKSYALIMHHVAPDMTKWYWILYNIPPEIRSLPKNATGVGVQGNNSVNGKTVYAPPHSKGPGLKTYILTVYALDAPLQLTMPPVQVNRDILLAAMQNHILSSASLSVTYTRSGNEPSGDPPPHP